MRWLLVKKHHTKGPLTAADIATGLSLVQFVYGSTMVLGLTSALGPAYRLVFPPDAPAHISARHAVILFALFAILILGVRFFWVPRNLYSYLLQPAHHSHDETTRLRHTTFIHVPITVAHALIFYVLCQSFVDLAHSRFSFHSHVMLDLSTRFVTLYALLLALNAIWLLRMTKWPVRLLVRTVASHFLESLTRPLMSDKTAQLAFGSTWRFTLSARIAKVGVESGAVPAGDVANQADPEFSGPNIALTTEPGTPALEAIAELIWGLNNAVFASLAACLILAFDETRFPTVVFLVLGCLLFCLNGIVDLYAASEDYVVFPKETADASGLPADQAAATAADSAIHVRDRRVPSDSEAGS